jgi:TrmH family RNA methyltransferase
MKISQFSIVLIEPEYEGNIGLVSRVLRNFQHTKLILVNPKIKIDAESRMRAMHGIEVLENAKIYSTGEEALETMDLIVAFSSRLATDRNVLRTAISPRDLRKKLVGVKGKIALMFGRESSGLSNDELELADLLVSIPANPEYPVFNISHAVAIVLYELSQEKEEVTHIHKLSSVQERNIAQEFLTKSLPHLGIPLEKRKNVLRAFKNLFGRSLLSHREVTSIIGFFHRVYNNISGKKEKRQGVKE